MAHQRKTPSLTEKANNLLKRAADALGAAKSSGELRGIGSTIQARVQEIDNRLREIAPPKPGSSTGVPRGGPAYEAALAEHSPDALAALADEENLLKAERAQLQRKAGEIQDARKRAEVREAHATAKELPGLCDEAEAALLAYQRAVKKLKGRKSKVELARGVGERIGEQGPAVPAEVAIRCGRLLCADGRNMNAQRVALLRGLGVEPVTRHLVYQAGLEPGEPVQVGSPDKAAAAELKSELKSAVNG